MTRIDFYVLKTASHESERWQFAARLMEKAILQKHQLLVVVDTPDQRQALEDVLLTFKPESYLPFRRVEEADLQQPAIISCGEDAGQQHDILINLSSTLPAFFSRFQRVIEVVIQQQDVLEYTREHWAYLKERGYPIHHHPL
ncbi:DNA polymerase III subunit chi [Gilvimarinus chinensis]|uniref:DNA polymerase III subunit chi n=1 Tax=Gilvimarinus chinensis TaxID=396005 RepID=UPI000360C9D5|nr:DNA polymerase III subunit chi [Gilvimarinus chinensis]